MGVWLGVLGEVSEGSEKAGTREENGLRLLAWRSGDEWQKAATARSRSENDECLGSESTWWVEESLMGSGESHGDQRKGQNSTEESPRAFRRLDLIPGPQCCMVD